MTPAIKQAKKAKIEFKVHEYQHDEKALSYGNEAAVKLSVTENRVFKTLLTLLDNGSYTVALVPVCTQLNLKKLAKVAGSKKAMMADKKEVTRITGYVLGGVSPLGQKKKLYTVIDQSAEGFATIFVSAGRRGLEIELNPHDLSRQTRAKFASISDL